MILSHRGFWLNNEEKNTLKAFERSFSNGFGTETDIRDYNGDLVISHDIPDSKSIMFKDFLKLYISIDRTLPLALNIKSDGLQNKISYYIEKYNISNYFVFDMSIPDTLVYQRNKINYYTRQSEYEITPSIYDEAKGVWLDEFHSHWITNEIIKDHLNNNKSVCIVSPELHKRTYLDEWNNYRKHYDFINNPDVNICTDKPLEAKNFFNGKN